MQTSSILGRAVKRVEDPRFIRGEGTFIANRRSRNAAYMATVRSSVAHGRIRGIDTAEAARAPGVIAAYTAADLPTKPAPPPQRDLPSETPRPSIAIDTVRFAGEIVAVVVAETERQAEDAASLVWADIEELPAVVDPFAALEDDAPILFEELGTNVVFSERFDEIPDVFDGADLVVEKTFWNQRIAAVPMEANAAFAVPTGDGIDVWTGSQNVFSHRSALARALGLDKEQVRVIVPDMGGGFGAKYRAYPEQILVCAVALELERPVRWNESRPHNLSGMYHGRDQWQEIEVGAMSDGRIVGLRAHLVQNAGSYPAFGAWLPVLTRRMAAGVYDIPKLDIRSTSAVTNTTPIDAYRGAGRPEATALIERAIDMVAAELGLDPVEVRRRNLIDPGDFPYETSTGATYDTGNYEAALTRALQRAGYEELREAQARRRETGSTAQLGIGVSTYVEITSYVGDSEWSSLEMHADSTVTLKVGTSAHGQGHETAYAQIVSDRLKIPMEAVRVLQGDTGLIERGDGTGGSRSLQIGGSSVRVSSEAMIDEARSIVADHYEADMADIVLGDDGRLGVAGVPDTALTWGEVALLTASDAHEHDAPETRLIVDRTFRTDGATYPFGAHVAVVEVDVETGSTRVLRHVAVDDCGTVVNPRLVAGQVHGGVAQGYGQALTEVIAYDDAGNLLTGNLVSYLIPTAATLPSFELDRTVTPTSLNPLGVKGIGEAGTIGSTPAVQNAVIDAVAHLGVRHIDMPVTPSAVWEAIQAAARD